MIKVAGIAVAILLALLYITGLKLDTAKAEAKIARKEALESLAKAEALQKSLDTERANAAEVAKIETQYLEALNNAKAKNDSLLAVVESGRAKLRIKANCPKYLPKTASADPGNDAGAAELAGSSRQAYYDLRDRHAKAIEQILALQGFARLCSNSRHHSE